MSGAPSTVNADTRSFDIVITTEAPVRTCIPDPYSDGYIDVDEVLLADGLDYSRTPRMPLIDNHDTFGGVKSVLGRVDNVRSENKEIVGTAVLTSQSAPLLQDIADGFFGQVSAGYVVNEYKIETRDGNVPLALATSWTLHEASLVPIGADPNASVRSSKKTFPAPTVRGLTNMKGKTMDLEALLSAAEEALDALDGAPEDGATDDTVARAARLRKLRADMLAEEDPNAKPNEDPGMRAEGDPTDGTLTPAEDKENADLETAARAFGLSKFVADLRALKAKPAAIRSALVAERIKLGASASASGSRSALEVRKPSTSSTISNAERARRSYEKLNNAHKAK